MTVGTVLITGAFGQIGKRCTQILLDRGRTVVPTDLRIDKTVAAQEDLSVGGHPEKLIPAYIDLLDAEAVRKLVAIHQPEAMIHLAAIVSRRRTAIPAWPEKSTWAVPKISVRRPQHCPAHRCS